MAIIQCPVCGSNVSDRATTCPKCGTALQPNSSEASNQTAPGYQQQVYQQGNTMVYNNTPIRPVLSAEQNAELDKFSWGAFCFGWIWALCNNLVLYGLIALVVSLFTYGIGCLIVMILFGVKGSRWAWEKSRGKTFEQFMATQNQWAKWGKIILVVYVVILIIYFISLMAILA